VHTPLLEKLPKASSRNQFLKAAAMSTKSVMQMLKLTRRQIEVTMFACGAKEIGELDVSRGKLVKVNKDTGRHF
jgi:isopentenyl diphosphate isomerase/L-lactate dehydrogenase-like FMN-dependent dehydrogenase